MSSPSYRFTNHALQEMARRSIPTDVVEAIIHSPQQIVDARDGRKVYQSKITSDGKLYLVRAIVEESEPLTVVTVYRTSKIDKYWRNDDESNLRC